MKWMSERDSLIAQTLAFVQSVTGTKKDAVKPSPVIAEPKVVAEPKADAVTPKIAVVPDEDAPRERTESVQPQDGVSRPIVSSELQNELRARIASFRAHQERFNREREEYFSATLARLRAALRDGSPLPPEK